MNLRLMVCVFLIGCSKQESQPVVSQGVERGKYLFSEGVDRMERDPYREFLAHQERVRKQSEYLLDIIKILYKDHEAEVKELEAAQITMQPEDQIERRIAL